MFPDRGMWKMAELALYASDAPGRLGEKHARRAGAGVIDTSQGHRFPCLCGRYLGEPDRDPTRTRIHELRGNLKQEP